MTSDCEGPESAVWFFTVANSRLGTVAEQGNLTV